MCQTTLHTEFQLPIMTCYQNLQRKKGLALHVPKSFKGDNTGKIY